MSQQLIQNITPRLQRIFNQARYLIGKYPVLVTAVYLAVVGNTTFWGKFGEVLGGNPLQKIGFSISFFILIVMLTVLLLQIFRFKYLTKPVLIFVLIASAFASYFMNNYGIMIDTSMVHNVLETDADETGDLLNTGMFLHVLLFGVLPAIVLYKTEIIYSSPVKQLARNGVIMALAMVAIAGNTLLFSSDYASFFRNHHHLRYLVNPVNYIYSFGKVTALALQDHNTKPIPIGLDAHQVKTVSTTRKNSLIVVVVGETARAMNFSLNGYQRDTNPELEKEDIINYPNVYSCGTST
ncbi:MAG: phosphoethanolamine transferase domain-containing protein, partial [Thiohalophilus sp.]